MKKSTYIGIIILTILLAFIVKPLLKKGISTGWEYTEQDSSCPEKLAVFYHVDTHLSPVLADDDVYLTVINPQDRKFNAEIFVDETLEGQITLNKDSKSDIKSAVITNWWNRGFIDESIVDLTEEKNQKTFAIDIIVSGCKSRISSLTPNIATSNPKSSIRYASRFPLQVTKSRSQHMPD